MTLPRNPADDLDRLMDDDAGELGSLYRRLPRVEPPKRLDRNVLGEAARAVRSRPPRHHGWMVGVGSAAGVVLAAGIAWQIGRNVAQQQSSHDAFHGAADVVPVEPITGAPARRREPASQARESMATQAPASPAASPSQDSAIHVPARKPEPRPAAAKPVVPPAAMNAAAPPPAVPAPQAATPFPADEADKRSDRIEREKTTAAVDGGASAAGADSRRQRDAATATGAVDAKKEEKSALRAAPAPSGSVELRRDMQLSPDDWIAHIRELVRQGRRQQALESLRLLRRMHPDVVVPAKLRALED